MLKIHVTIRQQSISCVVVIVGVAATASLATSIHSIHHYFIYCHYFGEERETDCNGSLFMTYHWSVDSIGLLHENFFAWKSTAFLFTVLPLANVTILPFAGVN